VSFSQVFFIYQFILRMNIYVSNLSYSVQDDDLRGFFQEYGEVASAKVIMDKYTNRSKGFGFVEMPDDTAAQKAIAELDGGMVEGRAIKVMVAKPKEERSGGNNGGGGRKPSYSNSNSRW
jgi:RNA recognition motif-containing protein